MNKFKVALALTTSLMFFNVHAASCLGEICVGEIVINEDNSPLKVISVNLEEGNVVARGSNGYDQSILPSRLSDEIQSSVLVKGKRIINSDNEIGIIEATFRNGVTLFKKSNGYLYGERGVSPEVESLGVVKKGVKILNSDDESGVVAYVFANNTVVYKKSNGYEYSAKLNQVAHQVRELGLFVAGARTLNAQDERGLVTAVFSDGRVSYKKSNGYEYVGNTTSLSAAVESLKDFKIGTIALTANDETVLVTDVFADKRVTFKKSNGYEYTAPSTNLSHSVESLEGGSFRRGGRVVDSAENEGVIKNTFADGRISYSRQNGYEYTSTTLSPEVSEHPKYSKETKYANNFTIAKPTLFYANGLVSFNGSITKVLSEQVMELKGISAGSEVMTLGNVSADVQEIYANGLTLLQTNEEKPKALIGKLSDAQMFEDKKVVDLVLQQLNYGNHSLQLVFTKEDAIKVRAILMKRLLSMNNQEMSKSDREKLLKMFRDQSVEGEDVAGEIPETTTPTPPVSVLILDAAPEIVAKDIAKHLTKMGKPFVMGNKADAGPAGYMFVRFTKSGNSGKCEMKSEQGMLLQSITLSGTNMKDPKKCVKEANKFF